MAATRSIVPHERIERKILLTRGQKVMLDQDLAALYGVETKSLNRAAKRHPERFPKDFMCQLSGEESDNLKCQLGTSRRWGDRRENAFLARHGTIAFQLARSSLRSRSVRWRDAHLAGYGREAQTGDPGTVALGG